MTSPIFPVTLHYGWLREFMTARTPCFALGLATENVQTYACLALNPHRGIPSRITRNGFRFSHQLLGEYQHEVIQFVFDFNHFATYRVIINPNNRLVQMALAQMMESGDYFFFVVDPDGQCTTFRAGIERQHLTELADHLEKISGCRTTINQYQTALHHFALQPDAPGHLVDWVCRDDVNYLDMTQDPLILKPLPYLSKI